MHRARQLRKQSTDAERLLWRHLRSRQLNGYKFRRQQPIGRFILDFVCFEKRLIVELDGGHHNDGEQGIYDVERSKWLEQQGYRVVRFWDHDVLKQVETVKEAILRALCTREIGKRLVRLDTPR
jgi:very-short-patch-repair endonuclease